MHERTFWTVLVLIILAGVILHTSIFPVRRASLNETDPIITNSTIEERLATLETIVKANAENIKTLTDRQFGFSWEMRVQTYSLMGAIVFIAGVLHRRTSGSSRTNK